MAKYPLSIQDQEPDGKMSEGFAKLLDFHVAPESLILDPTAGTQLIWAAVDKNKYQITFSDIAGTGSVEQQNIHRAVKDRPEWLARFNCIVYDPPYFLGQAESKDPREQAYGGYGYSNEDLNLYKSATRFVLPKFLQPDGLLIVKCADQYVVDERRFYCHHYDWMTNIRFYFDIVDLQIYRYRRVSPTAYQVKNRPCSIINHTYYIVGRKRK